MCLFTINLFRLQGFVVFAFALVVANAGVINHEIIAPLSDGTVLQGPSTKTHVVGPDGSQIIAEAPGGRVDVGSIVEKVVAIEAVPEVVAVEEIRAAPALIEAHVAPAVEAHLAQTKTSIVSTSIDQVHPSPAVAYTAPVVAVESSPVVAAHDAVAVEAAPIVDEYVAPVVLSAPIAAKTIVSTSTDQIHSSPAVIAHSAPVIAAHTIHAAPALFSAPYITTHVGTPVISARTIHAIQPIVSHGIIGHTW